VTAIFDVEAKPGKGERVSRVTQEDGRGTAGHKVLTFARKARIVDGHDGGASNPRTYLAMLTSFGHVSIMRGDMKFSEEAVFENDPRYPALLALFD
jgi:hypothetical protein